MALYGYARKKESSNLISFLVTSGWEYTVEATLGGYGPVEKNYHLCKRRRWVRSRNLVRTPKTIAEEVKA